MGPKMTMPCMVLASAALASTTASAQLVTEGGMKFAVVMTGANECTSAGVCGVGDPDASGTADITINPGQGRICWEITTAGVGAQYTISGAHIHPGVAGVNGSPLIHMAAVKNGTHTGCTTTLSASGAPLTRALIDQIIASPESYYLNIHWTPTYGPGAIRGQLTKGRVK